MEKAKARHSFKGWLIFYIYERNGTTETTSNCLY